MGLLHHLREGALGRRTLVERTGWTESVVRTELEKLEAHGWVEFAKPGTSLTPRASERLADFFEQVPRVGRLELVEVELDRSACGALVRAHSDPPKTWQVRDSAVREGASGILILRKEAAGLRLLDVDASFSRRNARDAARVESALGPFEIGDFVVIVFAADPGRAMAATLRTLIDLAPAPAFDRPPRIRERERATKRGSA
ncbi:MAG: hypothetical protein IPK07_15835 [Deltaproteobacteria bacterium]|nr:hypothetical protein [Deltaproteobacteria bacterium]